MLSETLLHIDEDLNAEQRECVLASIRSLSGNVQPHFHSNKEHMLFVAYDHDTVSPHELVEAATAAGVHAQLIDF